jgi:hypothetical protein
MKRLLLPLYVPAAVVISTFGMAVRAQGPPPQVPAAGWLWDVVDIGRYVFPATNDNWPRCGSVATCASYFVPQHECGVQVYELGRDNTWQGRSAHGETGTEPDYAGFKREKQANREPRGLPGCNLSFKNWGSGSRRFLVAWPNQNATTIPTRQLRILKEADAFWHEPLYRCSFRDPSGQVCFEDAVQWTEEKVDEVIRALPPPPSPPPPRLPTWDLVERCIRKSLDCPVGFNIVKSIKDLYLQDLRKQANGRWKWLPDKFIDEFAKDYPQIDLHRVQFAENIDTRHHQSMTVCNQVFLSVPFNPDQRSSLELMLHELYHSVQCANSGGEDKFLNDYIEHAASTIVDKRSLEIHDDIDLERAADAQATRLIDAFGWPIVVDSTCNKKLDLYVRFRQVSDAWVIGTYTLQPKQSVQLTYGNRYAHSKYPSWYMYAEEVGGSFTLDGNFPFSFNGEFYAMRERQETLKGENFQWKLVCASAPAR